MQNKVWYNGSVPTTFVKKSEQVAMKLPPELLSVLKEISKNDDRPLGYVARELMIRGLGLYQRDGRLRDHANNGEDSNLIKGEEYERRHIKNLGDESSPPAEKKKTG